MSSLKDLFSKKTDSSAATGTSNKKSIAAIKQIRDLEQDVLSDIKNSNLLIKIRKFIADDSSSSSSSCVSIDVKIATLHSLRRIFIHYLEDGSLQSLGNDRSNDKLKEYKVWLVNQYYSYQDILMSFVTSGDVLLQEPAIKTIIDLCKREYMMKPAKTGKKIDSSSNGDGDDSYFGTIIYKKFIESLLSAGELSADILLLLREHIFVSPDVLHYTCLYVRQTLKPIKSEQSMIKHQLSSSSSSTSTSTSTSDKNSVIIQNSLDILRMVALPENEDGSNVVSRDLFLCGNSMSSDGIDDDSDDDAENAYNDGDDDSSVDDNDNISDKLKSSRKRQASKASSAATAKADDKMKKKKRSALSRCEQLVDFASYKKVFSKAWLLLLSLPLSSIQRKMVLKHLADHVIPFLENPLLLSDYLTVSYDAGPDVVSVLALQSLFILIVKYNLDYPHFFLSLYKLCTPVVFTAKYRGKFTKLLTMCLKSTNLPAYLVAAFIKRLAYLSLHTPTTCTYYCIAQITWLLKKHPQCMSLLHKNNSKTTASKAKVSVGDYDVDEVTNLEDANAMQSSLWELLLLQSHHCNDLVTLVNNLSDDKASTSIKIVDINVDRYTDVTYTNLMEYGGMNDKVMMKKHSCLAYKKPSTLFTSNDSVVSIFGL